MKNQNTGEPVSSIEGTVWDETPSWRMSITQQRCSARKVCPRTNGRSGPNPCDAGEYLADLSADVTRRNVLPSGLP
jgi:hypothetical protein